MIEISKNVQRAFQRSQDWNKDLTMETTGRWRILGEDPNCDWGGPHTEPELEVVDGKLLDVLNYAVKLPGFFTYGGGGRVKLIPPKVITSSSVGRLALLEEKARLENRLNELKKELGE